MDSAVRSVNTIGLDRQWKELALYEMCRRVGILEGCEYSVLLHGPAMLDQAMVEA